MELLKRKMIEIEKKKKKNSTCMEYNKQREYHDLESPAKITVLSAMHLRPAAPKPTATRAFSIASTIASGNTIPWFFAPMLCWTGRILY